MVSIGALPDSLCRLPCRENDPELWFSERPARLEMAKLLCGDCPIRRACLQGAVRRQEPWGVWGGEILADGAIIPRKRPRGRPRKADRVVELRPSRLAAESQDGELAS